MDFNFLKPRGWFGGTLYNQIVQTILYATAFLLPLFYLPLTSSPLELNKQLLLVVAAGIGLIVWLLGIVVTGTLAFRTLPMNKGMLGVLGASGVATIFSLVHSRSIFGVGDALNSAFMTIAALTVLYFLAVNTLNDRGQTVSRVLGLSMMLALVIGVAQMFGWYVLPGDMTHTRSFNTIGSVNALGIVAAITLAFFSKVVMRGQDLFDAIPAGIGLAAAIAILAVVNWWILWIVALAGMLAVVALDSTDHGRFTIGRFLIPTVVVVLGAFLMLVRFDLSSVKGGFPVEIGPNFSLSWRVTRGVLGERLVYGYGPSNTSLAFDAFAAREIVASSRSDLRITKATSELFTVAIEGGILAIAALLFLGWCLIRTVLRSVSISHAPSVLAGMAALIVAAGLYPFNLTLTFLAVMFLAIIGLAGASTKPIVLDTEENPRHALASSVGFIMMLIAVLTSTYYASARYLGDHAYAQALTTKQPASILAHLESAISWNGSDDRALRAASHTALLILSQELDGHDSQRLQSLIRTSVQLAEQATHVVPEESLNWNTLGVVYQSLGGLIENVQGPAEAAYRHASERRPGDPSFDNAIGMTWVARADALRELARNSPNPRPLQSQMTDALGRAATAFTNAIEQFPSFGPAIYNLASVYERQGNIKEAIGELEKIAPYNANQAGVMFELGILYLHAQRKDDAIPALERAVLADPGHINAHWYLGLLLEDRGDLDGALAHFMAIQETNPDNADLIAAIKRVEAGYSSSARIIDSQPLQ